MDLIKATHSRLFTIQKARTTFVQSSAAAAIRQQNVTVGPSIGNEKSSNSMVLLVIVTGVGLMHALGVQCFFCPGPASETLAKPLVMQVSTITIPAATSEATPKRTPPPAETKPFKKAQPKPRLKKQNPSPEGMAFSREEQALRQLVRDFDMRQFAITEPDRSTETQSQAYTEAYLDAAYDRNPKPEYPSIARSRGWQGKVVLRVQISAEGKVEAVEIEKSSSHELLDESAVEAIKHWSFVPAMRANKAVATSVLVPIIFTLQDQSATP